MNKLLILYPFDRDLYNHLQQIISKNVSNCKLNTPHIPITQKIQSLTRQQIFRRIDTMKRQYTEKALLEELYNSIEPKEQIWSEADAEKHLGKNHIFTIARVGTTTKLKMNVTVSKSDGLSRCFHVVVLSEKGYNGQSHMVHINFERAEYSVGHCNKHKLNANQRRELDRFFREHIAGDEEYMTNWDFAIANWNDLNSTWKLPLDLIQPDYNNLPLE